jgi:hypothetical protein
MGKVMKEFKALVRAEIRKAKSDEEKADWKKFSHIIDEVFKGHKLVVPNRRELTKIKKELKTKWKVPQKVIDNFVLTE